MSDEQNPAGMAGEEGVTDDQVKPEVQDEEPKVEAPEGEEAEAEEKPKRESAKERRERDKQYKQRLREDAETARKEREAAEARRARIVEAGQQAKAPVEKDFDDYTDYAAAKAVWAYGKQAAEREVAEADTAAEQARQREQAIQQQEADLLKQNWKAQATDAASRYTDFAEVVGAPWAFPEKTHLPDLIMSSEMAGDLAYHLARDRNLHDALLRMTPIEAAREIGRIESRLTPPRPRTETQAPDPINPVRPKASPAKDPAKMTFEEFRAWRESGGTY
jgi:hypothetical protein